MIDILEILRLVDSIKGGAFFYTPLKKGNEISYLFRLPDVSITCNKKNDIGKTLSEIDKLRGDYLFAYGYITYETGYAFEERLENLLDEKSENNLLSFHFFNSPSVDKIRTKDIDFSITKELLTQSKASINNFQLNTDYITYGKNIQKIKKLISKGDTYQVNYTLKSHFDFDGNIIELFLQLLFNQSASYTAIINDNNRFIISISPELFFKTERENIVSKPMKGTIKRGINIFEDKKQKEKLSSSKKNKAENIMIVDLLRNDLGKICTINSVTANPIYAIEQYETVYQMTSTVMGKLKGKKFKSIIENLFPCGSITGAPKIRTMEIIKLIEKEERGIYTGTIGIIDNNDFIFNIPIRTIIIDKKKGKGELGIGGGIVWDSNSLHEFQEAGLKGKFITNPEKYFELIETMLIEKGKIFLLDYHIKRLRQSAAYFLFYFNENKLMDEILNVIHNLDKHKLYRLRILLSKWGEIKMDISELSKNNVKHKAVLSSQKIDSQNKFQFFKTTNRKLYDEEYIKYKDEYADVIFLNGKEKLAEGSITNIIIKIGEKYYTPPIEDGILNGCYREYLLDNKNNIETKSIGMDELLSANELILINSVRKEIKISELYKNGEMIKRFFK